MKISLIYLGHRIEFQLPDPQVDNTIYVSLWRKEGTYNANLYNAYLVDFQFSATHEDPNDWLVEAISNAVNELANWGTRYYEPAPTAIAGSTASDEDHIPF